MYYLILWRNLQNKDNSTQYNKFLKVLDENGRMAIGCFELPFTWYNIDHI